MRKCAIDRHDYEDTGCLSENEMDDIITTYPGLRNENLKCLYQSGSKKLPRRVRRLMDKFVLPSVRPEELLSEVDILIAMKQWQRILPNMVFIGVYGSDALSKIGGLRRSFQKTIEHFTMDGSHPKSKIAFILNTDRIATSGAHWVAVLVCKKYVEYFDPLGKPPNEDITKSLRSLVPSKTLVVNDKRLQSKESIQCGVWSMMFILERVSGKSKSIEDFVEKGYTDSDMAELRGDLFAEFSEC